MQELDPFKRDEALLFARLSPKAVTNDDLRHELGHGEGFVVGRGVIAEGACEEREDADLPAGVLDHDFSSIQFGGAGAPAVHESMACLVKSGC